MFAQSHHLDHLILKAISWTCDSFSLSHMIHPNSRVFKEIYHQVFHLTKTIWCNNQHVIPVLYNLKNPNPVLWISDWKHVHIDSGNVNTRKALVRRNMSWWASIKLRGKQVHTDLGNVNTQGKTLVGENTSCWASRK